MRVTPTRSTVPDLLFEDTQTERLAELEPLLRRPDALGPATPLNRITVFVTHGCNLACAYCKTVARDGAARRTDPRRRRVFDVPSFERLIDSHAGTPIRHVHFTGGEASLVRSLPEMVRRARARGVERVSLTTNGTLPPERYLALVDAGLDEIRISLDSADRGQGDALAGRAGAWDAAVETLDALSSARQAGEPFFLIVNTVVTPANQLYLPATLRFFLGFALDDLKLIADVDRREDLGAFPEGPRVRAELDALLAGLPPRAFPLLRRKLRTVFSSDAVGLDAERSAPGKPWRCFIPLTERTVDSEHYYPCSVYLREGGAPLGAVSDRPEVQRARSGAFVRDGDCQADPICRRYCLYCTRTFNSRANELLR